METESQAKTSVQEVAGLQQIYIVTRHWLDEMLFLDDEIRFLRSLFDKYFDTLLRDEHVNRVQLINDHLNMVDIHKRIIKDEILTHQANLDKTLKNNIENREAFLNLEHDRLEEEIKDLNRRVKGVKNEIFQITEMLLLNKKLTANLN